MVVVWVSVPETPVTVTITRFGTVAVLLAVRVRVLLLVTGSKNQEAVTPFGRADVTAKFTVPVKPA
jgi:hypothetical protein